MRRMRAHLTGTVLGLVLTAACAPTVGDLAIGAPLPPRPAPGQVVTIIRARDTVAATRVRIESDSIIGIRTPVDTTVGDERVAIALADVKRATIERRDHTIMALIFVPIIAALGFLAAIPLGGD